MCIAKAQASFWITIVTEHSEHSLFAHAKIYFLADKVARPKIRQLVIYGEVAPSSINGIMEKEKYLNHTSLYA